MALTSIIVAFIALALIPLTTARDEFHVSALEIRRDGAPLHSGSGEPVKVVEGSELHIGFTLDYPTKPRSCAKCHLYPPNQVVLILQPEAEDSGGDEKHREEQAQERIVWFAKVNSTVNGSASERFEATLVCGLAYDPDADSEHWSDSLTHRSFCRFSTTMDSIIQQRSYTLGNIDCPWRSEH